MSLITSAKSHLVAMAQRAATLGRYRETEEFDGNDASSSSVNMPAVTETVVHDWSTGYPTITEIDSKSGLLTTSTAGAGGIPDDMTVYDLYASRAQTMPDEPMYHFQHNGKWVSKSTTETLNDIRSTAKGLLHAGMRKGDSVAFMCHTSYEWNIVDAAVLAVGGVIATIYDTDSAEQIRYIVNNSDASLLIVETREMREKADGAIQECESLQRIACLENGALEELQAYGASVSDEELDARLASIKANDLCSIVYTSGSTAAPKGVEMTHAHYCNLAVNLNAYIPDLLGDTDGS
ncbi:MAG: AMP-binding protein, partial [Bifidobacterium crudilactis]|nr:AMP-binding protein [Bifidobacterium crudilactis]